MIGDRGLIHAEGGDIDSCSVVRHRGEFIPGNEASTSTQRDQLSYLVAVTGDCERLAAFDGIHDLLGSVPQVALRDLRLAHRTMVRTACYGVPLRGTHICRGNQPLLATPRGPGAPFRAVVSSPWPG